MPSLERQPKVNEWGLAVVAYAVGVVGVALLAGFIVSRRRRSSRTNYPHLLSTQSLKSGSAVPKAMLTGPRGLKQCTSPLQSPLSTDSTPSPLTPLSSLVEHRTRRLSPSELPIERGKIDITLAYDPLSLSLQVGVIRCRDLCELSVSPSGQCLLDPYVKLQLLPDREHRVKTRIVRATNSPQFDEHFTLYGVAGEALSASTLHIQVVAFDRYSRDAIVGEACYRLDEAHLPLLGSTSLTLPLGPQALPAQRGEVLLSLNYQPSLNSLTVVVVKARGLMGTPDPYAKLTLRDEQGRRLARKRTHVHRASRNPVFNESFVFELPQNQLEHGLIDVQMMQQTGVESECIGRLLLTGKDSHISDAIAQADQQIAQWHPLD